MSKKIYIVCLLIACAVVCVFIVTGMIFSCPENAKAGNIETQLIELCRVYTESNDSNGIDFNDYLTEYRELIQDEIYSLLVTTKVNIAHKKGVLFDNNAQY